MILISIEMDFNWRYRTGYAYYDWNHCIVSRMLTSSQLSHLVKCKMHFNKNAIR